MTDPFHEKEHETLREAVKRLEDMVVELKMLGQRNHWLLAGILLALLGNSGTSIIMRLFSP